MDYVHNQGKINEPITDCGTRSGCCSRSWGCGLKLIPVGLHNQGKINEPITDCGTRSGCWGCGLKPTLYGLCT